MSFQEQKPHVLYILPVPRFFSYYNGIGGHITHAYGIIKSLSKYYNVHVLVEELPPDYFKGENIFFHICPNKKSNSRNILARQVWFPKLIKKIKNIISKHKIQFCYMRYSVGFSPWIGKCKKTLNDIPLVIELNSFASQKNKLFSFIESRAFKYSDLILPVSELVNNDLYNINPILSKKTIILPNGVSIDKFDNISNRSDLNEKCEINIGFAGQLKSNYGLEYLIEAFKIAKRKDNRLKLHFYGDGSYKKELQEMAQQVNDIIFHGVVPYEKMEEVYSFLDILIYTTDYWHKFQSPIKLYEYLATGKPVIAAQTPHTNKLIDNEKNGYLFDIGDYEMLADKILKVLSEPQEAMKKASKAKKEIKENHSWESRVETLLNELKERRLIE
ncbi:glycosyltransferase family 4 protein [Natranaerobius thermophilus]|uniref:Glycosyl transferase group 1 n=1 Tax=Natranaerobius thermophilus (strain ATCC BAA-1301 / DSM 18059 / JW/NM-WN-LF) TaxID=457570 RepID=B2A1P4_NATTJ|nr:glycosyltransferase family 4 protein [Natranaerobius thermophilus]ACB86091.1 glycosyl transferase group 1 [Natranaerobius thermophilus JW/NM-WN-LF]